MGENKSAYADEVAALRLGIDLGMTLIDTAEMYGEGGAEKVVADAIEGQRDCVFVVTKVSPHNASRTELPKACERSLKRLRIEVIDLYLLHWRSNTPLAETVEAFERLRSTGKIRRWGVSNFDVEDMSELFAIEDGSACAANQVLYNLEHRAIESGVPGVIAIPKAGNQAHVRDNAQSVEIQLTDEDFAEIDREFPPPTSKEPLLTL